MLEQKVDIHENNDEIQITEVVNSNVSVLVS